MVVKYAMIWLCNGTRLGEYAPKGPENFLASVGIVLKEAIHQRES
jgi:hypothetical protein